MLPPGKPGSISFSPGDTKQKEEGMTKKEFFCLVMVLVGIFGLSVLADAATIKNKTNQRLAISLTGGKTISLTPGRTANLTDAELSSSNVQTLIRAGKLEVVTPSSASGNKTSKPAPTKSKGKQQ